MAPDFGTLTVSTVVMHELPRGRAADPTDHGVVLTDAPIEFGTQDKSFLETRLRSVLGGHARDVVEDPDESSPSPDAVRGMLDSTSDIVECSREMAARLRTMQAPNAPASLLLLALATIDSAPAVVISKLDHEQGMRVEPMDLPDGRRTYQTQYLKDLILGQGTRVFKAAVFLRDSGDSVNPLCGHVVDAQFGTGNVADYFLRFLGCGYVEEPRVLTQRLLKASQKWIAATCREDPELHARYEIALLSEMQSNGHRISAEGFAATNLEPEHQDQYVSAVMSAGVPRGQFSKDTSLVATEIRRVKVNTERDATIIVPPAMYEDGSLKIENTVGSKTRITIEDDIRSMSGASGKATPPRG